MAHFFKCQKLKEFFKKEWLPKKKNGFAYVKVEHKLLVAKTTLFAHAWNLFSWLNYINATLNILFMYDRRGYVNCLSTSHAQQSILRLWPLCMRKLMLQFSLPKSAKNMRNWSKKLLRTNLVFPEIFQMESLIQIYSRKSMYVLNKFKRILNFSTENSFEISLRIVSLFFFFKNETEISFKFIEIYLKSNGS